MAIETRMLTHNNAESIADWCGGRAVIQQNAVDDSLTTPGVNVLVGDVVQRAQVGDTVIRNDDGSFRIQKKELT